MSRRFVLWVERAALSWTSFHLHTAWFALWLLVLHRDINELTMWVSLEAIYLCILLGIAQQHHDEENHHG